MSDTTTADLLEIWKRQVESDSPGQVVTIVAPAVPGAP